MGHPRKPPSYLSLAISLAISVAILLFALFLADDLGIRHVASRLLWPLFRLMIFISMGLLAGEVIEGMGWTKSLAVLAGPLFRFGNLGNLCSAAFTTAFISGVAANAMLLDFYKDGKITRAQLYLTNFVNQLPAYFLHLPTTFFIVISLTGQAGLLYFLLTFAATLVRTILFLGFGHMFPAFLKADGSGEDALPSEGKSAKSRKDMWKGIRKKFPARVVRIAVFVVPIYTFVFVLSVMGFFDWARQWLAQYIVTTFMPVEALSMVILSFAAEFTSGFAAAGALLDANVLTIKQTTLALIIGNVIAFPIRALRHQLPRYMGIFSPKMGTQLLLMGQGFRVLSILVVGLFYYHLG